MYRLYHAFFIIRKIISEIACIIIDLTTKVNLLNNTIYKMRKILVFTLTVSLILFGCKKNDTNQQNLILAAVKELKSQNDSLLSLVKSLQEQSDSILMAIKSNNQNELAINARIDSVNSQLILVLTQIDSLNILLLQTNVDIASIKDEIIKLQEKCAELSALILQLHNQTINLSTGLLAYYPFSGNAGDSSGNGNHGTVNGATLTADRFGNPNRAYKFGTNKNIDVLNPSTALNLLGSFTISSWIYFDTLATTYNNSCILSKHDGDLGGDGWTCLVLNPNHDLISQQILFWSNNIGNTNTISGTQGVLTNAKWYHFVATYDHNAQNLHYFLNNQLILSIPLKTNVIPNNRILTIGWQFSTYGTYYGFFRGTIDEIRIYDRVLNTPEIEQLYAQ